MVRSDRWAERREGKMESGGRECEPKGHSTSKKLISQKRMKSWCIERLEAMKKGNEIKQLWTQTQKTGGYANQSHAG